MAKEKPLHMRSLEEKLGFLKDYIVPGKKGYKEISDTQTILPDEIKASINNYLVNKKAGLGHGKNEENGLPKKYSLGDNEELRHSHARNILVQVARAIYARKTSVEAAKEIKDDEMLLTFLDEY